MIVNANGSPLLSLCGVLLNYFLKVGICGEHGGEPDSVQFFHSLKFDYVSCSPFRVPIARISAGQAAASEALEESAKLYRETITNVKRAGKKTD